jgi:NADH-quinone oxidoreductase subunit L
MLEAVWLIPALPLAGFVLLLALGRRIGEPGAGWLATALCGASFLVTIWVFVGLRAESPEARDFVQVLFAWVPVGSLRVDAGFLVDPLSITMALFVTGVGALIHLYAIGYMHGDKDFPKFFVYMNLFIFSMLMLVLGNNLLITFLGWEGVGACSYFLISFWFGNEANASAGKKAFITNRIGDWGFMLAIFLAFATLGTIDYRGINATIGGAAAVTATALGLLLFVGAIGKSAQIPLYIWLPDAMAGPTPVSALIHAATMVTAGVFLMTRVNPILAAGYDWVPDVIAWFGVITALVAATIAIAQNDIKKVLAYSTISQLGYMFLAVGVGAYVAAIFHMVMHAFFKALLFLGSGSVIHGMHDEQDMRRMGALRKVMPITAVTFMIGWLSIAGVPPFSGFWSKDEILLSAWASGGTQGKALWAIGLVTALITAFYMSRQVFLVFFGKERWNESEVEVHAVAVAEAGAGAEEPDQPHPAERHEDDEVRPHESPWIMLTPLAVLAVLSTVGGVLNLPFSENTEFLARWLEPVVGENELVVTASTATKLTLVAVAVAAALVGIGVAAGVYLRRRVRAAEPAVLAHAYYYDEAISAFVAGPGTAFFNAVAWFDTHVIDGAVNGVAWLVARGGRRLRHIQSGFVRNYALGVATGVVVVLAYIILRIDF